MNDRSVHTLDELLADSQHPLIDLRGCCVVANGCFDLIHPGHLQILRSLYEHARMIGATPIVALNSDESVRRLKGPSRPIMPLDARIALLTNLRWPLSVVVFDEDTLRPVSVIKGSQYPADSVIRWIGSMVVTVEMVGGWSTTGILGGQR